MKRFFAGQRAVAKSKLAQRLVPILVAVVAAPLAVTVLIVGRVGQQQIVETAQTMQGISDSAVHDAGTQFQRLGSATVQRSGSEMAAISLHAGLAVSRQSEKNQADLLSTTSVEFARITQADADSAMLQSLATNKVTLRDVSSRMGKVFAYSARYKQDREIALVERGYLSRIDIEMQDRAEQLAQLVQDYVRTNQNYLALTAQMLNLYQGNPQGQKAVLDALVRRMPMLNTVSVLDMKGQEVAMSASDHVVTATDLTNRSSTSYFRVAIADQPYVSVEDFPSNGSAPTLRLAVPIELYRGKVVGVLAARLSLDDVWDVIRDTRIGKSGCAFVTSLGMPTPPSALRGGTDLIIQTASIDPLGWRVTAEEPSQEVLQHFSAFKTEVANNTKQSLVQMDSYIAASSKVAAGRLQEQAIAEHTKMAGQVRGSTQLIFEHLKHQTALQTAADLAQMQQQIRYQAALIQNEHNRQMISAATTASQAVANSIPGLTAQALRSAKSRLSFFALLIMLVSGVLCCLIGLLLANAIVRPIVQLAEGTKAVAHGDLLRRVNERATGEIGDLAVAFNTMAASLQKSRTDLSEAEAQLVQSAKLASLGTLSAGVAHELNQPVAIVRGLAQQLRSEPQLSRDVLDDLALIEGQTSRMMKIIKHLRTFCRVGGAEMVTVDVNQVIRDCFILIGAQLKAHEVNVQLALSDEALYVIGDANELEQVFINLITNSQDAMEGRPDSRLTVRSRIEGGEVKIEVSDNGPGVPETTAAHIFDPFFTTKEVGKGTGLGLSISHSIMQKHQGAIAVRNDGGAVFEISLPLNESGERFEESVRLAA